VIILRDTNSPPPHTALDPPVDLGLLIVQASRSHPDTSHSVILPWTSDQPYAKTSSWQHRVFIGHRNPCFWKDSNPQSQDAGRGRLRHLPRGHWVRHVTDRFFKSTRNDCM